MGLFIHTCIRYLTSLILWSSICKTIYFVLYFMNGSILSPMIMLITLFACCWWWRAGFPLFFSGLCLCERRMRYFVVKYSWDLKWIFLFAFYFIILGPGSILYPKKPPKSAATPPRHLSLSHSSQLFCFPLVRGFSFFLKSPFHFLDLDAHHHSLVVTL